MCRGWSATLRGRRARRDGGRCARSPTRCATFSRSGDRNLDSVRRGRNAERIPLVPSAMPYVIAFVILAALWIAYLLGRQRPAAPGTPPARPPAGEPERTEPDRGMSDPLLRRLYLLLHEITQVSPEVTRPEHLATLPGYRDTVRLLADPTVSGQLLLDLVQGERLYPAIAALDALTLRAPDAAIEAELLAQLNRFHPWNADGVLRALEACHPDD